MTARHELPKPRSAGPTWEVVVGCVFCALFGGVAVASVRPPYIDRPYAVTTTVTAVVTVTPTPTPTPTPAPSPTPSKSATPTKKATK